MATYSDHQQRMLDQGRDIEEVRQHRPRVTEPDHKGRGVSLTVMESMSRDTNSPTAAAIEAEGRRAYEADVQRAPLYHDGTPRKTWEQLGDAERWSWARRS
jgi:hypothetical protein